MKILFVGDTHGNQENVDTVFEYAENVGVERIIQVGDFGFGFTGSQFFVDFVSKKADKTGIPFYFIRGNHDNPELLRYNKITELAESFFFIPNSVPFVLDGISFVGAGGAYSIDKGFRREGYNWWRDEEISAEEVRTAALLGHIDVIVSHDSPITSDLPDRMGILPIVEAVGNRHKLQQIVEYTTPKLLIHGHYHKRLNCISNYTVGESVVKFPSIALGFDGSSLADQVFYFDTEMPNISLPKEV